MKKSKKTLAVPPLSPDATGEEVVKWLNTYNLDERLASGVSELVEDHSDLVNFCKKLYTRRILPNSTCVCRRQ